MRVCEGLSCSLAGAGDLLQRLPALLGAEVRTVPVPCIGRCEEAPAVCVGQNAFGGATSFLRRTYTKDLTGVDLAITGVPSRYCSPMVRASL